MTPIKGGGLLMAALVILCTYTDAQDVRLLKYAAGPRRVDTAAGKETVQMRKDRLMMRALIRDLVTGNIIGDEKELVTVELTDQSMLVNGRKQPLEVWRRFRNKYITTPGLGIFYSPPLTNGPTLTTGKGLFLDKDDPTKAD